jgi:hypothetical protein
MFESLHDCNCINKRPKIEKASSVDAFQKKIRTSANVLDPFSSGMEVLPWFGNPLVQKRILITQNGARPSHRKSASNVFTVESKQDSGTCTEFIFLCTIPS